MDMMDTYLRKRLQNWAAKKQPPVHSKVRLLHTAARITHLRLDEHPHLYRPAKITPHRHGYREHSTRVFDWTIVYSFEMSLANLRLMY